MLLTCPCCPYHAPTAHVTEKQWNPFSRLKRTVDGLIRQMMKAAKVAPAPEKARSRLRGDASKAGTVSVRAWHDKDKPNGSDDKGSLPPEASEANAPVGFQQGPPPWQRGFCVSQQDWELTSSHVREQIYNWLGRRRSQVRGIMALSSSHVISG